MTQAQTNHIKKLPISANMKHTLGQTRLKLVINYSHVPMKTENSTVPELSVLRKAFFALVVLKVPYLMMHQVNTCKEKDTGNCWCYSVSMQWNKVNETTYHPSVNSIFADMFLLVADKLLLALLSSRLSTLSTSKLLSLWSGQE